MLLQVLVDNDLHYYKFAAVFLIYWPYLARLSPIS